MLDGKWLKKKLEVYGKEKRFNKNERDSSQSSLHAEFETAQIASIRINIIMVFCVFPIKNYCNYVDVLQKSKILY